MITKNMNIGDILKECPESADIMGKYGLHCIGCRISTVESLEDGCRGHGLRDEDIDNMVKEINDIAQEGK